MPYNLDQWFVLYAVECPFYIIGLDPVPVNFPIVCAVVSELFPRDCEGTPESVYDLPGFPTPKLSVFECSCCLRFLGYC